MQRKELEEMSAVETDHWWYAGKRLFMRRLLGDYLFSKRARLRILDVGCGTGANAVELASYGEVTACDRSLDALGMAAERGARRLCALLDRSGLAIGHLGWASGAIFLPTAAVRWMWRLIGSVQETQDVGIVPRPLNTVLCAVYRAEVGLAATVGLPFGVSLAAIAVKRST